MTPLVHSRSESLFIESHAHRSHLCRCHASIDHVIAPAVHEGLPLVDEVLRDHLREVILDLGWPFADRPEESPLCIEVLRVHSQRLVFFRQSICQRLVVSSLLHGLRSDTCLKAELGAHVS